METATYEIKVVRTIVESSKAIVKIPIEILNRYKISDDVVAPLVCDLINDNVNLKISILEKDGQLEQIPKLQVVEANKVGEVDVNFQDQVVIRID